MRVLLVSTYELGHQPLGLASPAAALRARGHEVRCLDLAVEEPSAAVFEDASLVAISVPMHTAARLGIRLARRVRRLNSAARIVFYGLYATTLHDLLMEDGVADAVVGGEYEPGLCDLADALAGGTDATAPEEVAVAASIEGVGPAPALGRQRHPVPDRSGLPALDRYAFVQTPEGRRVAGYVEASRGCAHRCTHCPITPVYGGALRLVEAGTVLTDIDRLVAMGAEHITFGDPDFLNAVPHSLAIVERLHARHPDVTFDVTAKVEHLLEHRDLLPGLRESGCLFVTSAFESCSEEILRHLGKGHTASDMDRALDAASDAGLPVRPTWVAFTPWASVEDFLALLAFIEERGLVRHVQPVQYGLRLLLPPGSPLVDLLREQDRVRARPLLGEFDAEGLTHTWTAEDTRIDALQRQVASIVEDAATRCTCDEDGGDHSRHDLETFAAVKGAALAAAGRGHEPVSVAPQPDVEPPRLTEDWFC